ncbi:MAG: tagatose 1,6-diphosphate aldolase [Acidobacteriaceae bacterium]|nr:tagatose 1,6-diphosphate aldolase [Acidobacteriaceae bacterium]
MLHGSSKASLALSRGKRERLRALSTPEGVIAALAVDQRKSLRRMLADAASCELEDVQDAQLTEFKIAVSQILTLHTSAILLDPEYGMDAARQCAASSGLLLAYEMDGYENPRPHRMLALQPEWSVRRLRDAGADGIKILLHYAPDDLSSANEEKCAAIERIGCECHDLDLPFFLEPVVYDPRFADPRSFEFALRKPQLVVRTIEEFSKEVYKIDVLKVEFPVILPFVEGAANGGRVAYSRGEALDHFRAADAAARRPYIYLSAGVDIAEFLGSLLLANQAGARASGVLCGRAIWKDGIRRYAQKGPRFDRGALEEWLRTAGTNNVKAIRELLAQATPWHEWFEERHT